MIANTGMITIGGYRQSCMQNRGDTMHPETIAHEINKLSISQKLLLTQDIWDSIAREGHKVPMPQWQKEQLEKRYELYKEGDMELHDWQQVHEELRAQGK